MSHPRRGAMFGLLAAALFGVSAPLAKALLGSVPTVLLAGLLYLGAALGLLVRRIVPLEAREAPLRREDLPRLALVVLFGGIWAPVLMLWGVGRLSALTGSLLLNLEAPFTMLIAVFFFREHLGRVGLAATACILGGALVLRLAPGELGRVDPLGMGAIALACLCWALDNNLTQQLALKDPFAIVRTKALVAGLVNCAASAVLEHTLPPLGMIAAALCLGSLSYGVSVVLDAYALRLEGAAREAAFFATAPAWGVLTALVLGDVPRAADGLSVGLMAIGVVLLLRERHHHAHSHDADEHEHVHVHDEHHAHEHDGTEPRGEPHSHPHRHLPLTHAHAHGSDLHHRHRH